MMPREGKSAGFCPEGMYRGDGMVWGGARIITKKKKRPAVNGGRTASLYTGVHEMGRGTVEVINDGGEAT